METPVKCLGQECAEDSKKPSSIVLLVEDEPITQKVHRFFLKRLGFSVETAESGRQALACFQSRSYAAVLLDKGLPDQDGTEVCRAMRRYEKEQSLPSALIVAVTTDSASKNACLSAGCNDFLMKPLDLEDLKRLFKQWIPRELLQRLALNPFNTVF